MLLKVKEVAPRYYISPDFGSKKEILLILESTKGTYSCHLREDWVHMEVEVNDLVYVSGRIIKHSCQLKNFIHLYYYTCYFLMIFFLRFYNCKHVCALYICPNLNSSSWQI